ncbi:phosphoglycerate kinase [Candidatus Falkowbacteria bacterium]|nr:phosphoglycerate kinase [Candidatus Falkowbacteria bacterium]
MKIKTITTEKNWFGRTVLVRVDFNVPMNKNKIKEDYKITANLPTIKYLLDRKAKVILITHLGEPTLLASGKVKDQKKFSTKPLAVHLSRLLKKQVVFISCQIGSKKLDKELAVLKPGQVVLLENIRFYPGELSNDKNFAKQLAGLADIYVNNAFAVSHRKQASVSAIKSYLPSLAGLLLELEVLNLSRILKPTKPFIAIIGGSKISGKVPVLKSLLKKADYILVGGAVANNFLAARGFRIGKSLSSAESIKIAKKIDNKKIILPIDVLVGDKNQENLKLKKLEAVGVRDIIYDIGPETMKLFAKYLRTAQTMVWNGPMGVFENPHLKQGTLFIGRTLAMYAKGKAFGVVGGGETVEALRETKMMDDIDWVSTGGGASLSFLGGEAMPGLEKLL